MPDTPQLCTARKDDPPWFLHTYPCTNRAKDTRDGHPVCGVHAKMYDRNPRGLAAKWGWKAWGS